MCLKASLIPVPTTLAVSEFMGKDSSKNIVLKHVSADDLITFACPCSFKQMALIVVGTAQSTLAMFLLFPIGHIVSVINLRNASMIPASSSVA